MREREQATTKLRFIERGVDEMGYAKLVRVLQQGFDIFAVTNDGYRLDPNDPEVLEWLRTEWRDVPLARD